MNFISDSMTVSAAPIRPTMEAAADMGSMSREYYFEGKLHQWQTCGLEKPVNHWKASQSAKTMAIAKVVRVRVINIQALVFPERT